MTIITKPLSEKKGDKLVVPLVENDQFATAPTADVEAQAPNTVIFRAKPHRVSATTTLCLLLTALIVVGIGIWGGSYLYSQYLRLRVSQGNFNGKFEGWAQIPFQDDDEYGNSQDIGSDQLSFDDASAIHKFLSLRQHFEIDNGEKYEKISVPDFRDDRNGRFIHDFNTNITCIIDTTANRCFVMPLDRQNILPPKSMFDLIHKMWEGYYKIDTKVIRETMRVITPPITDMSNIGIYITRECEDRPVYKLEKYVSGVVKRSADLDKEAKFAHFAGKNLIELDFINMDEVAEYEKNHRGDH